MKKLLFIAAAALMAACSSQPENGYTVNITANGDLTQLPNDTLVLVSGTRNNSVKDTLVLVEGKAVVKGEVKAGGYATLIFKGDRRPVTRFYLENANYNVVFDAASPAECAVEGGVTQAFLNEYEAKQNELSEKYGMDSLMQAYRTASEEEKGKIMEVYNKWVGECEAIHDAYLQENPTSDYALSCVHEDLSSLSYEELVSKIAPFDSIPAMAENPVYKEIKEVENLVKSLQPGNKAPDFTQNDPDGKPVKFSDIYSKNKITMVDFWASWCGPCRAFNPDLVKIYKKFHRKGFEILGVSNDNDKEAWLKGIKDDKLTWPQVSDLKGWDNEVGKMYYVRYIPQNIFVDQNGVIIGRQVEKTEIEALLEKNL